MGSKTLTLIAFVLLFAPAAPAAPPPAMQDLGVMLPTPEPTQKPFQKKRLITSITVRNSPEGETIVTFEATDVAEQAEGRFKTLASDQYTLSEESATLREHKEQIIERLRELERKLLEYVDVAGPPRESAPLFRRETRP